jgi:hypothetical protein
MPEESVPPQPIPADPEPSASGGQSVSGSPPYSPSPTSPWPDAGPAPTPVASPAGLREQDGVWRSPAPSDTGAWAAATGFDLRFDPEAVTGPPWPRLVAVDGAYTPPRLLRWPVVVGLVLTVGWIAASVTLATVSTSSSPASVAPYVLTASDAHLTATFPGKPDRVEKTVGTTPVLAYVSTLSDHSIGVTYFSVPASAAFNLDGAITGAAAGVKDGKVLSRTSVTYHGQPAEDATLSFSGGAGHLRVVVFGSSAYLLEGFGTAAPKFATDFQVLLDSFTSTSTPTQAPTSASSTVTPPHSPVPPPISKASLAQRLITPAGFAISRDTSAYNGPVTAARFDSTVASAGAAAALHYVTGYARDFGSTQVDDLVSVQLLQFATAYDASTFVAGYGQSSKGFRARTTSDPALPGATVYDSTTADTNGAYVHGTVASKGDTVMIVDYINGSATRPEAVDTFARQQYAKI